MLKTISTLLITTNLFSNCYASALERPNQSLSHMAETHYHGEHVTRPASVEEFENFLRSNLKPSFSMAVLSDFFSPFKAHSSKFDPKTEIKLRGKAIEKLQDMIVSAEEAFLNVRRKQAIPLPGMPTKAAPREEVNNYYYEKNHRYFLTFQKMVSQTLEWAQKKDLYGKDAKDALTLPYGQSDVLGFAWLRDQNGIVPIVPDFLKKGVYHSHVPYGDWGNFNAGMVFVNKKLITERSVVIESWKENEFLKITQQYGATNNFLTFPIVTRIGKDVPLYQHLISTYFTDNQKEIEGFIFPGTPNENNEFEAAWIEKMIEEFNKDDPLAIALLEKYGSTLNPKVEELPDEVDPKEVEKSPLQSSINPLEAVQRRKDELYEKMICEQQEAISQAFANPPSYFTPPKKRAHKNKNQSAKAHDLTEDHDENALKAKADELKAQKDEILSKLKNQGRQKWGGLINIIMAMLAPHAARLEFNNTGSHFKIHIKGQKESAGLTLITPHGRKGGEVPASVARNLASELFDLIAKLSEKNLEK